jgi:copper chaperone CopZ
MHPLHILFSILFLICCTGCNDPELPMEVKKKPEKRTMSLETSITASSTQIVKISIPTVVCKTCEKNIKTALSEKDGIIDTKIDIKNKMAEVKFDPAVTSVQTIRKVISEAGYDADGVKRNKIAYQNLDECCKIELNIHS